MTRLPWVPPIRSHYIAPVAPRPVIAPQVQELAATTPFGQIRIGQDEDGNNVDLAVKALERHAHFPASTGAGKTVTLEVFFRCIVMAGHGCFVLDPHGGKTVPDEQEEPSLLHRILAWLDDTGYLKHRQVCYANWGHADWTTGIDPLGFAGRDKVDPSSASDALIEVVEAVGDENTDHLPRIARTLGVLFRTAFELGLTVTDIPLFLDPVDGAKPREWALQKISDPYTAYELKRFHETLKSSRHAQEQTEGGENRLSKFLKAEATRLALGLSGPSLRLDTLMDEQAVLLCNLQKSNRLGRKGSDLMGTLLLRGIMEAAWQRKHPKRKVFVLIDECHRFLIPGIQEVLDELRKRGIHFIFCHQRLGQLRAKGDDIYSAVMGCTNLKIVGGGLAMEDAEEMARNIIPLDLETPIQALVKPTVTGYGRALLNSGSTARGTSNSDSSGSATASSRGRQNSWGASSASSSGDSIGLAMRPDAPGDVSASAVHSNGSFSGSADTTSTGHAQSESSASSNHRAHSHGTSSTETDGWSQSLEPILEDRPGSVHSRDALTYMAARKLRMLGVGELLLASGCEKPIVVKVPLPRPVEVKPERIAEIVQELYEKDPAAVPTEEARRIISERQNKFLAMVDFELEQGDPENNGFE